MPDKGQLKEGAGFLIPGLKKGVAIHHGGERKAAGG